MSPCACAAMQNLCVIKEHEMSKHILHSFLLESIVFFKSQLKSPCACGAGARRLPWT